MAWQLIYTSAPRSLEAGRSGFGTVARHREISPLLMAAIERASQFSRLPGVDTGRVIYSYRIIVVAGGRYHVLSSTRDAGADYTGRTNHIAHHLVAEPGEIVPFGAAGPSPADVLLGMRWATSWTGHPRFLEAADVIPLAGFQRMVHGSAWEQLTGSASQAWLLASGEGSRGAYVIQPAGTDLLQIFGESLGLIPERLWKISFTTSLQPSDEPADFRWIGIEETSPLRVQTETSGRPIFNLTAPATLPTVEVVQPAVAASPVPQTLAAAMPAPGLPRAEPRIVPAPLRPAPAAQRPSSYIPPQPAAYAGRPAVRWRPGNRVPWLIGGGAVIVGTGIWLFVLIGRPIYAKYRHRKDVEVSLDQRLGNFTLMQGGFGRRLEKDLKTELAHANSIEAMDVINALAAAATDGLMTAYQAHFEEMRRDLLDPSLRQRARDAGVNIPAALNDLDQCLKEIAEIHRQLEELKPRPEDYNGELSLAFEPIRRLRGDAKLKKQAEELKLDISNPEVFRAITVKLDQLADRREMESITALLREAPAGRSTPDPKIDWFERALAEIKQPDSETETEKLLNAAKKYLTVWKFIDQADGARPPGERDRLLRKKEQDPVWPGWLKARFDGKNAKKPAKVVRTEEAEPAKAPPAAVPAVSSPALYFMADDQHFPVALPSREPNLAFFLHVDGRRDEELQPFARDIKNGLGPDGQSFKIQEGKLRAGSKPPPAPYVFIGKRDGAEAFRIYVGMGRDDKPIFGAIEGGLKREGDEIVVDLTKLPGTVAQPLFLRLPGNFGAKGSQISVVDVRAQRCPIGKSIQELKEQLEKVSANTSVGEAASGDAELNMIRGEIRKLSERPKSKNDKKGNKAEGGDVPADVGTDRPAVMLAVLFEKYWEAQVNSIPNPASRIRAELAKKPELADWGALLVEIKKDFQYGTSEWLGKSAFDAKRAWAERAEALTATICASEANKQTAEKNAAAAQARATRAEEAAKRLSAHPLLNGQIPPGVYTLLVGDDDRRLPLADFSVP